MITKEVKEMIRPWLTGNDEKDARMLKRLFPSIRLSIGGWRQVVTETKAA